MKPKMIIEETDSSMTDKSLCGNEISLTYVYETLGEFADAIRHWIPVSCRYS